MNPAVLTTLQAVLLLALSPLTVGVARTVKARLQNRRGASVFQPYWALYALSRKEMTVTRQASWVFHVVPFVVLGSALGLTLLIPTLGYGGWFAGQGSIFLLAALLAIGALFLVFGGMDVASAFGGMGASREMTLAALIEPATVLIVATFGAVAHTWHLDGLLAAFAAQPWYATAPFLLVTFAAFAFVILLENARYPVDNPATHLELTMVHEAMVLEYSGPYLAMLETASAIKLTALGMLFLNLLLPFGLAHPGADPVAFVVALAAFILKAFAVGGIVALVESTVVKMRFYRMQEYVTMTYLLAMGGLSLTLLFTR